MMLVVDNVVFYERIYDGGGDYFERVADLDCARVCPLERDRFVYQIGVWVAWGSADRGAFGAVTEDARFKIDGDLSKDGSVIEGRFEGVLAFLNWEHDQYGCLDIVEGRLCAPVPLEWLWGRVHQ